MLVEGPTEQLLIPEFAKILGYDFTDYGISVISTNDLGFEHFVNIFKRKEVPYNQIPVAVIIDADKKNHDKRMSYSGQIKNGNNRIECFIGEQLYSDTDLAADGNKKTTFEKIIFNKTTTIKEIYIESFNSLKSGTKPAKVEMDFEQLYEKISHEKAPTAQEAAERLSEVNMDFDNLYERIRSEKASISQEEAKKLANLIKDKKPAIKKEIEENLKYITDAIKFVIPNTITVIK